MSNDTESGYVASNLLAEKVISLLRRWDMQVHRRTDVISVPENKIREIFTTDSYLKDLSAREQDDLQALADTAIKAHEAAQRKERERAESERRAAAELKNAQRVAALAVAKDRAKDKQKKKQLGHKVADPNLKKARQAFDHANKGK